MKLYGRWICYITVLSTLVLMTFLMYKTEETFELNNRVKVALDGFNVQKYLEKKKLKSTDDAYRANKFNQRISDNIGAQRSIPDTRNSRCSSQSYNKSTLPKTSVIITFYNEARSTLLRTIVRSPPNLIEEIILVDDHSDDASDGQELAVIEKVKVIRNKKREGLIRSRIKGAAVAKGEVLTFLDSHCEVNTDWLEPLLNRIHQNRTAVVSPVIDVIDRNDFQYVAAVSDLRGGFDWNLIFTWEHLPKEELDLRTENPVAPIKTPMIAGGLFSINKAWFIEVGQYDMQMDVWGGENLEISFRVWQCHGSLEIIPCSRVGHVFRREHPYSFPDGSSRTFTRNTRRVAEVWMDQYKEQYYKVVPSAKLVQYGNIMERKQLRERLKCNSFDWYIDSIYPQLRVKISELDDTQLVIQRRGSNLCLDYNQFLDLQLNRCQDDEDRDDPGTSWRMNEEFQIYRGDTENCLTLVDQNEVTMTSCDPYSEDQKWSLDEEVGLLRHVTFDVCITGDTDTGIVSVTECYASTDLIFWDITVFFEYLQ